MALAVQTKPEPRTAPTTRPAAVAGDRLVSLDAYRGFVMLAMASGGLGTAHLLKDPTWGWLADQLEHRAWEGCTFWDLIQPSFMFIVGVAMPFSFARRQKHGDSWGRQFGHVLWRAFLLVAVGVFLDSYGGTGPVIQMIRVLQQIALGYIVAFFVLGRGPLVQALTAAGLLVLHTAAFWIYAGTTGPGAWVDARLGSHNFGSWLDGAVHLHLTNATEWVANILFHRPSGIAMMPPSKGGYVTFNAVSSAATILFGVLCGELFRSGWPAGRKLTVLGVAGALGLLLGALLAGGDWDVAGLRVTLPTWVPMVKRIWTASFALFAAGWTCLMMLAFYLVIDVVRFRGWAPPFVVVGMNSILMYVLAQTMKGPVRQGLNPFVGGPLSRMPAAGPVILSVLIVAVLWLFCYWLYRRGIFLKL
jgi:heparan-alpha-glucosaminide N-acetyltransferase